MDPKTSINPKKNNIYLKFKGDLKGGMAFQ